MLFSSNICTCQLPLEPSARGACTFAFSLPRADRKSSMLVGGVMLLSSRIFLLYQSALPRWTLTGTDQTSPFELTMSLRSLGIVLSQPSLFQTLVIGSIFEAFTQVLISSWPAWTWKLSGGLPPSIRVLSTALAFVPAPPATVALTICTPEYFCL